MKLVVIGGSLATGKTTLSRTLAEKTGFCRVSMDEIKAALFTAGGYEDRAWSKEIGRISWDVFQQLIRLHLFRGHDVIAEATFLWPTDAQLLIDISQEYGADIYQIWLTANKEVARTRFLQRAEKGERHPGHCDSVETVLAEFDERFFRNPKCFQPLDIGGKVHVVDTTDFAQVDHNAIIRFVLDDDKKVF